MLSTSIAPQSEAACTYHGAILMQLLRKSCIPCPKARRLALREAIRIAPTEERVRAIAFEALSGSPYIPEASRKLLAEQILVAQWGLLVASIDQLGLELQHRASSCTATSCRTSRGSLECQPGSPFLEFRDMALALLYSSRKIQNGLPLANKRRLFLAVHKCQNKDELVEMVLQTLEHAITLDHRGRQVVANDMLDGNFHFLVLPDRLDCDEDQRIVIQEECAVCLEAMHSTMRRYPCVHRFCDSCLHKLPTECPMCRAREVDDDEYDC